MAGVTPNEPEGLSQSDIDAALAAAGDGSVDGSTTEDATSAGAAQTPLEDTPAVESATPENAPAAEAAAPAEAAPQPDASAGFVGLSQEDIDAALAGADQSAPDKPIPSPVQEPAPAAKLDSAGRPYDEMAAMMEAAIAEERAQAQAAAASMPAQAASGGAPELAVPLSPMPAGAIPLELPSFSAAGGVSPEGIELLNDVELNVKIELGRAEMLIEDVLRLGEGSVVELDKLAGDPVDVLVNDRLVARGEVIVLNENFCVRVSEIVAGAGEEENN